MQIKFIKSGGGGRCIFRVVNGHHIDFALRWIPSGSFLMGSPEDEDGYWGSEGPQHEVTIAQGFWMGEVPVTQALYKAVMGHNPSHFAAHPQRPVEQVSWEDAQSFCRKLGPEWTLPTEAEWEYACRAGTQGHSYAPGVPLGDLCWYRENTLTRTQPVGLKRPNAWGLHDMLGNVWEWCSGIDEPYMPDARTDEYVPDTEGVRMSRGGSWLSLPLSTRPASRGTSDQGAPSLDVGFRLVFRE